MNEKEKPTTTTVTSPERMHIRSRRPPRTRTVQNFILVWLDGSTNEDDTDYQNIISKLYEVVNTIIRFTDTDECVNYITNIEAEKIFMLISGFIDQTTVSRIHELTHVDIIYIFCGKNVQHDQWTQRWSKVKDIFSNIKPICEALKQAAQQCDQNTISMSFVAPSYGATTQNLDQLDQSFMYTQILKEILLTIDFKQQHINDFIDYCREQFVDNNAQLNHVDTFEREYCQHTPIWWYTSPFFLYSILNRSLRTMEVELIVNMGFFLRDLHQQIETLHSEQFAKPGHATSFTVYRGQGLSQADFDLFP
jgi:hypothetical protein